MRTQLCCPFGDAPPDKGLRITAVMQLLFAHNNSNPKKKKKIQVFYLLSVLKKEGDVKVSLPGSPSQAPEARSSPALSPGFLSVIGLLQSTGSHRLGCDRVTEQQQHAAGFLQCIFLPHSGAF